ncbi:class I SAM-dependent methyltransferase [Rhodopirellula halodulae]|uniref:class I SAM-dependent methyltransferase n=1 Tax=Rhodopirellula halodulae TaxID=2894198 RepID=UPI001E4DB4BA|nr:class I SAM-dependent methyltransferase [Rhodopirellula sp. JC737]MCC9654784.1 methyltransferase domain-containing protein [Rhodopirellula sp. JC737]
MTASGSPLCQIVSDQELVNPLKTVDGAGWLGDDITGAKVLCLAAGGGRQSSLYAAAGAHVTVVDLSPAMLEQDRVAARKRGHQVELIEGSMDDLSMLPVAHFDIVIHPVSTCYLPSITAVYAQVARVIRGGGLYISQHKSPTSLQSSTQPRTSVNGSPRYTIEHAYYRNDPSANPAGNVPISPSDNNPVAARLREPGAVEFLHRWEEMIGGLCRCGFVIEDLSEPLHAKRDAEPGSFADRARYIAPYVRIKARRSKNGGLGRAGLRSEGAGVEFLGGEFLGEDPSSESPTPKLWIPEN